MADITPEDISDSCDNVFISICIWNMSVMERLSPLFWSSLNFAFTASVCLEIESVNAEYGTEPPELVTVDVGAEPTLDVGAEVGLVVLDVEVSPAGVLVSGVEVLPPDVGLVSGVLLEPDVDDVSDVDEVLVLPESVVGAAAAKPLPRPRAAKPREPAITALAASFWMVLMVVISGSIRVVCRLYYRACRIRYGRGECLDIGRKMRLVRTHVVQMMYVGSPWKRSDLAKSNSDQPPSWLCLSEGAALAGTAMVHGGAAKGGERDREGGCGAGETGFDHLSSFFSKPAGWSRRESSASLNGSSTTFCIAPQRKHRLNTVWPA
jgi:hypothetical protein